MKRSIAFFGWSVLGIAAMAQTWCPPGAKWWFRYGTISGGTGYVLVEEAGDTTIANQQAHKLTQHVIGYDQLNQWPIDYFYPDLYTALVGDVVSLWTQNTGFDTLFHYSAVPGSQWGMAGVSGGPPMFTVTDTGTMIVDALPLRWWSVSLAPNGNVQTDTIVERIGALSIYLLPGWAFVTDPEVWELRCYEDPDISFSSGSAPWCTYILGTPSGLTVSEGTRLWPNPSTGELNVDPGCVMCSFSLGIHDALGRLVLSKWVGGGTTTLDLQWLSPGAYSVELSMQDGSRRTAKWTKQ